MECENSSRVTRPGHPLVSGILNERVLFLVFGFMKWDIAALCRIAAVNWKLRALAKRLLWRELCFHRAPRMASALTEASQGSRIIGGWLAIAKLLFFCGGCESSHHFKLFRPSAGHFAGSSRFSKTSGRSFLAKRCRGDVLYVSDPCEHVMAGDGQYDVGAFRGVFPAFMRSRTRECLIRRRVEFEAGLRCSYCGARVWNMTAARLIPRRSAARRLGSSDDAVECFVCLNGHLHGVCRLVPLSSDDDEEEDNGGDRHDEEYEGVGNPFLCNKFFSN